MRKRIEGRTFEGENILQNLSGTNLYDCVFAGGEYALKQSVDIAMDNCIFADSYPLWHVQNLKINDSRLEKTAVGSLHGCENGKIMDSDIRCSQALQECKKFVLHDCSIFSEEFGRSSEEILLEDCTVHAGKLFWESRSIKLDNVEIRGDAALRQAENVQIYNTFLKSDNALQDCRNITIVDSVLKGDFLGWNCENITLIGCKILGMQPLCHCRNLKLVDCSMEGCNLAFEYSDVKASIVGHLDSVKNPLSGKIVADSLGHIVKDDETFESTVKILVRG